MSEPVKLAKTAREHLASALNTLQSEADIPDALMDVADPIAEAMSILHRIERSGGGLGIDGRADALSKVRAAFDLLLDLAVSHPAVDAVTESVALSICKTSALVRCAPPPGARSSETAPLALAGAPTMKPADFPAAAPSPVHVPESIAPAPQPVAIAPLPQALPGMPLPQALPEVPSAPPLPIVSSLQPLAAAPVPVPSPQPLPTAPSPQPVAVAHAPQPVPVQPALPPPALQPAAAPARDASPVPGASPEPGPTRQELARASAARVLPAAPAALDISAKRDLGPRPPAGTPSVDVDLGTHSPSNFYKGLGGNDVIENGGIFVATYKIPKVGATVNVRVHLPGNYEFYANAVVQWVREAGGAIDSSEPGFGARFTQISPDGRQLVYRYTHNREPIFYDDL